MHVSRVSKTPGAFKKPISSPIRVDSVELENKMQIVLKTFQETQSQRAYFLLWSLLLTRHGILICLISCGHKGMIPSSTGARKGQARPNILFLTARGLSVTPSCLKLSGMRLLFSFATSFNSPLWKQGSRISYLFKSSKT